MAPIKIRAARKEDCLTIAKLYSIASDGVADYIWTKMAEPGEDILEVGRRRYEREGTAFSFQNCIIVEIGGDTAGMLVAFPMQIDPEENEETDPVLAPYSKLEEDQSYYICDIALFDKFRRQGIGSQLMALAEQHAKTKELCKLSLIVFQKNASAKKLYDKLGYREVCRSKIVPHPLIHYTGDAILMVKAIE